MEISERSDLLKTRCECWKNVKLMIFHIRYCRELKSGELEYDLEIIANLDCTTPLAFGGGIRDSSSLKCYIDCLLSILLSSAYFEKNHL